MNVLPSVLLVGSPSPIGRAVEAGLTGAGHEVVGISRTGSAGSTRLDVQDTTDVREFVRRARPSAVVYLARPDLSTVGALESAVLGIERFARVCAAEGIVRFVFASSAAVYGTSTNLPHREDEMVTPAEPYALLKLQSERALATSAAGTGMSTVSLRIFNVFGPRLAGSLVNRLVLGDVPTPVVRTGPDFVRDYVHSSDVARAVVSSIEADLVGPSILNIGSGHGTSNDELLQDLPSARFVASDETTVPSHSIADITRARAVLGFEPTITPAMAGADPWRYLR